MRPARPVFSPRVTNGPRGFVPPNNRGASMTWDKRARRRPSRSAYRATVETLEVRQVLTSMLGLTATNQLASFDTARPDVIRSLTPITGLQAAETILGIDSRPVTGQVYALGSTGRLYTLDPATGASTLVGTGPLATPLSG